MPQVFEEGKPVKCNPLAWWTFKDCFDYLQRHGLEYHPLHNKVCLAKPWKPYSLE